MTIDLEPLFARLRQRGSATRTEADIQADVRELLLHGGLDLDDEQIDVHLEAQAGDQRRIDVEVGLAVIETKKDLRKHGVLVSAEEQLADYVRRRTEDFDQRYVGILTDGADWYLYTLMPDDTLARVSMFELRSNEAGARLVGWLSSVLATTKGVNPTPREIEARFGASSPGFELDRAALRSLWDLHSSDPEVALKKELWGKLLHTAFGDKAEESIEHFIEHTYLVITAELIAHALLNVDTAAISAEAIVSGDQFHAHGVYGVVEADFFDWPVGLDGGEQIVRAIARRVAQIDWSKAEHDILKHLYESVIAAEQRHSLGEYYTPDWLAANVVTEIVDDPATQRVLDPACGSGTFLFHAVQQVAAALEANGAPNRDVLEHVSTHVIGMDVHPVAVTLARVTYLLAIGTERLNAPRGDLHVPVFLGDSVQWQILDTLSQDGLTVYTDSGEYALLASELYFPRAVMGDPQRFDRLVADLTEAATARPRGNRPIPKIGNMVRDLALSAQDRAALDATFSAMCDLHDNRRDHIWGYYIRNLARPLWLSDEGRVDRIIGNPPWLSYRFMDPQMKKAFKSKSQTRNLWVGGNVATQQDLAPYFLVRACELYLKASGRFGMVMPLATLSRRPSEGFRTGKWDVAGAAQFDAAWDLEKVKPPIFPVPSAVVTGTYLGHSGGSATPLLGATERWSGKVTPSDTMPEANEKLTRDPLEPPRKLTGGPSPYRESTFIQGANVVPRALHIVERAPVTSGLGLPSGLVNVVSRRSSAENKPWKLLPSRGPVPVEQEFVRDVHLGSTLVPFRMLEPWTAVLPIDPKDNALIGDTPGRLAAFPRLRDWWETSSTLWVENRTAGNTSTLLEWINWSGKLAQQLPGSAVRLVYPKSGTRLAAAVLYDSSALIDHTLYWGHAASRDEALYLAAILNAEITQELVEPLQSRGNIGARHFDLYPWELPIPRFSAQAGAHTDLAELGRLAEEVAGEVDIPAAAGFQKARKIVREALAEDGVSKTIEVAVRRLLGVDG